ncbi:hypothetical protein PK98_14690 [Croceibacterium mercuriale]|uniref:Uncharacterized protein n=1 Tax=Croceibacterium mercuriale TaxID=1572751 RepID=A0A0B2BWP0_9SPHN|nr:hypothetical protein PK98_14690 [Croceibacterium mercuriale]
MTVARLLEEQERSVALLHIARMDQKLQGTTINIDDCVPLTRHDFLAGVVATWPGGFGGLDRLAFNDRWLRRRFPGFAGRSVSTSAWFRL